VDRGVALDAARGLDYERPQCHVGRPGDGLRGEVVQHVLMPDHEYGQSSAEEPLDALSARARSGYRRVGRSRKLWDRYFCVTCTSLRVMEGRSVG
jgi:hypothetical protein